MRESVPFAEWAGELWYSARLSGIHGAEAKASLNRARVLCCRPETEWSSHEQVEVGVKPYGGPNQDTL